MYQIKFGGGYEIRVIGRGENGLCKVAKSTSGNDAEKFSGTCAECEQWLAERGIQRTAAGQVAHDIARLNGR